MNKIYLVEQISRQGIEPNGIPVEDVQTVGYFTNKKLVDKAKLKCLDIGITADKLKVTVFPLSFGGTQGSMMYGTTIKPINEEDDYDVDLVCKLTEGTENISAKELKQSVGRRLATHKTYKAKLNKEGRRCWTLQSEGQLHFHMDILPAIPYNKSHLSNAGLKIA